MKVIVLGGYGNFGARICRALSQNSAIELWVAGRDLTKSQTLASKLNAHAIALDVNADSFTQSLRDIGSELIIHTAGPFQGQDYRVAQAAAMAGCHYIDLADGRRFVCDFSATMDDAFLRAGRVGITGASTLPALSTAVIDSLMNRYTQLHTIDICIAPAQQAPRGEATMAAVLSYCGKPIQVWQEGKWVDRLGWSAPTEQHFARMKPRLGAICDVPDLELLPARYAGVQSVSFRAALEVKATQRALALLASLRSRGWFEDITHVARQMSRTAGVFDKLGSALGGMFVRLTGVDKNNHELRLAWHISADHNHGPEIPCMATILLARKLASGAVLPAGAHACMGLLTLSDFEAEFDKWGIQTDLIIESSQQAR